MQGDESFKNKSILEWGKTRCGQGTEPHEEFGRTEIMHRELIHIHRNITRNVGGNEVLNNLMA